MTGRDVALKMLHDNGIYDVQVTHTPGRLTDHYNPTNKTVNLSEGVYESNSIMAAAVAAHECGHAVQHARMYAPLKMRSALVPVVNFASSIMTWVLLGGILLIESFPQLLLAGIILFAMTTLFSFITLPVEIDASKRALVWLSRSDPAQPGQYFPRLDLGTKAAPQTAHRFRLPRYKRAAASSPSRGRTATRNQRHMREKEMLWTHTQGSTSSTSRQFPSS